MREPCPLPLVALRGDETCPRCGRPAREHRGHPAYEDETMTETTEPTREKIAQWLAQAEANDWGPEMSTDDQCAVLRLALRTLDAEAQLAAMTERAEKAERALARQRELAEAYRLRALEWDGIAQAFKAERDEARAQLAEAERERDEARMAAATAKAHRDHWRTVAESRPDISREDAGLMVTWLLLDDFVPEEASAAIRAAWPSLRAHAAAPKGDASEATEVDHG